MAANTFKNIRHGLHKWDKGSNKTREQILQEFVKECENATAPELEVYFHDCGSLFLARITSWLRITYMFGTCINLQLQAIVIFVSASTSYLAEFLEVGGILTLLEIINLKSCHEDDKAEGLRLLGFIATKGRQYKEMICESYGIKVISECLVQSQKLSTQECAQNLLHQLSLANPRYQAQVYKTLVALLSSCSSDAQRLSTYTLRQIQPHVGVGNVDLVGPLLQLLKSLHLTIQHEAALLIIDVLEYENLHHPLLQGLVTLLKPEDLSTINEGGTSGIHARLQQANAAKVIREILCKRANLGEKLISFNVVPNLLFALGTSCHTESQRQACSTIKKFISDYVSVKDLVEVLVGESLFKKIQFSTPDDIHDSLTLDDVEVLVGSARPLRDNK